MSDSQATPTVKPFRQFLRECRAKLENVHDLQWTIHVCMGNEAADLDSMISANALAYHYKTFNAKPYTVYVPMIDIPKHELRLRTAATFLFGILDITIDDWIFKEDLPLEKLHKEGRLKLSLTDHNRLSSKYDIFDNDVVEIIDHHKDENHYEDTVHSSNRNLVTVGSCCTLITERWMESGGVKDVDLACLLLAPILLDTLGLDWDKKKVTTRDEKMAYELMKLLPERAEIEKIYLALAKAKQDITGLTQDDLLRADYKEMREPKAVGFSSMGCAFQRFVDMDVSQCAKVMGKFIKEKDVQLLVLLSGTTDQHGMKTRELGFVSYDQEIFELAIKLVDEDQTLRIEPDPAGDGFRAETGPYIAMFYQRNKDASRKVVLPLMKELFARR